MADEAPLLLSRRRGHRLDLTLNRPQRRNALSQPLLAALGEALRQADADAEIRLIVLSGAGEQAFCAGGDLAGELGAGGVAEAARAFAELLLTLDGLGTPLLARVAGHGLGGGLGLLLACDLAVAADDVLLGTPEVRAGVFPMLIAPLVVRHAGPKRARELFFSGRRIDAAQALDWGLLNRVVPRAELEAAVDALADEVLAAGPAAVRLGRQALARTAGLGLAEAAGPLADGLVEVLATADAAEGIAAFLQKRPPEWKNR